MNNVVNTLRNLTINTLEGCTRYLNYIIPTRRFPCKAICTITGTQCKYYTKHTFCKDHHKIFREFCRLYHIFHKRAEFLAEGMQMTDIIETEIHLRQQFQLMFQLDPDIGHQQWITNLQRTKEYHQSTHTYESLFPYYSSTTIHHWNKADYINVDIPELEPELTLSQMFTHGPIKFDKQTIYRHYFNCKCPWREHQSPYLQALNLMPYTRPLHYPR